MEINKIIPLLPDVTNFSTDEGGIKQLYHSLSACTGDNLLAKAQ